MCTFGSLVAREGKRGKDGLKEVYNLTNTETLHKFNKNVRKMSYFPAPLWKHVKKCYIYDAEETGEFETFFFHLEMGENYSRCLSNSLTDSFDNKMAIKIIEGGVHVSLFPVFVLISSHLRKWLTGSGSTKF